MKNLLRLITKKFDWVCENCGTRNYESRSTCIHCGNPFR